MVIYLFNNPTVTGPIKDEKSAQEEGGEDLSSPPPPESSDGILEESSIFEMRQRTFRTGEARTESEDTRRRARVQKRNRQEVFKACARRSTQRARHNPLGRLAVEERTSATVTPAC